MTARFSIPKPCSEDWNKMDATAQGAFCAKCTKEVVDCTTLKTSSIKSTLETKSNPCIRILKSQIDEMNFIEWFNTLTLMKQLKYAFLFAYIIVFSSNGIAQDTLATPEITEIDTSLFEKVNVTLDSLQNPSADLLIDSTANEIENSCSVVNSVERDSVIDWVIPEEAMIHIVPENSVHYVETTITLGMIAVTPLPINTVDRSPFLMNANSPTIINDSPYLALGNSRFSFHIEGDSLRFFSYAIQPERVNLTVVRKGETQPVYYKPILIDQGPNETLFSLKEFESGTYIVTLESDYNSSAIQLIYWY